MNFPDRPRLNAIAGRIVGEFLLGYTVVIVGLWLASHTSDGATGDVIYPVVAGIGSHVLVLGLGSYILGRAFALLGIFIAYVAEE